MRQLPDRALTAGGAPIERRALLQDEMAALRTVNAWIWGGDANDAAAIA